MITIKFFATVALICITSIGMANDRDTDNRDNLMFGFKAGLNYSNVYDSQTEDFNADPKVGLVGGAFLTIPISTYLGLQPEILLSQKGFKGNGVLLGDNYSFTRTTTYVDIPLLVAFKPSEFISLVAGPQYSYLLRQNDVFSSTNVSFSQEQEFNNENIRKNIFGFVAGMDINLKHIIIGTRLGWDIHNNTGDGTTKTPRYKNAWFQATVGYTFK